MNADDAKQAIPEIELFSEVGGSPRIFKLEGSDAIGIEMGGKVCIKPLAEWHRLGWESSVQTEAMPQANDVNAEAISILTQRSGGELFIPNGPDIRVGTTFARVEEGGVRFRFSPKDAT